MTQTEIKQETVLKLSEFDQRQASFARVRALILKIVYAEEGLTNEELSKRFLVKHHYLPRIDNRVRELRSLGLISTVLEEDKLLHIYPKKEEY
jgi:hypothetical protein